MKKQLIMNLQLFAEKDEEGTDDKNTDITDLQNTVLSLQETIKTIQEQNQKLTQQNTDLFLRVTGDVKKKETKDENAEYIEHVGKEFYDKLSPKERKQLIIILEGEDE